MKKTLCVLTAVALCVGLTVPVALAAQETGPGYVDLANSGLLPGIEPTVCVSLVKPLLRVAAVASSTVTPEIGELLGTVNHVEARVYEDLPEDSDVQGPVDAFLANLAAAGWFPTVKVADNDDRVTVLMKTEAENIVGAMVLVAGRDEVVCVNLCGNIEPERTGQLISIIGQKYMNGELLPPELMAKISAHKGEAAAQNAKKANHSTAQDTCGTAIAVSKLEAPKS